LRDSIQVPSSGTLLGAQSLAAGVLRLPANEAPEHARPDLLREFFYRLGVRYEVMPTGREPIKIDLTLRRLTGLQFSFGRLQGARYLRTRAGNDPTEDLGLVVNPRGSLLIAQRGREIVLGEGDATLVSFTETLESEHRAPGDMLVLRFPMPQLAPRLTNVRDCALRRIPHGTPALKLLTDYIDITEREQTGAKYDLQDVIVSHFYDLIAVTVGATRDAAETARGHGLRVARLHAIKQDIASNLDQPDLSVGALAVRHGCTPRFIQRLFEHEGTSFTDYVLAQRLALAHSLLTDPRHADEKIITIALDTGFGDLSYFNRAFRRRYGDTPSSIRVSARRSVIHQA
jgi:AraC-like DNA-binding protein